MKNIATTSFASFMLFFISEPLVIAGTVSGSGNIESVPSGSVGEQWQVLNGATLNLSDGANSQNILVTGGSVFNAGEASIDSSDRLTGPNTSLGDLIRFENSTGTLNGTIIRYSPSFGSSVAIDLQGTTTFLTLNSVNVNSVGRAINLAGQSSLSLNDSVVRSSILSVTNSVTYEGIGIQLVGGNLTSSVSTISGEQNAVRLVGERTADDYHSTVILSGTTLISDTGAAIKITNTVPTFFRDASGDIELINGSSVTSGNGNLIEVDHATTSLLIDNSSIIGNIVAEETGLLSTTLQNYELLTGLMSNGGTVNIDPDSTWNVTGSSNLSEMTNGGAVIFTPGSAGRTLTINGDYTGSNGLIAFNTGLAADDSLTDMMRVSGNTSGTTRVSVTNAGGSGAKTINGIELISVAGSSGGDFVQQGRIVAGAYDYQLQRGNGALSRNWYLSNELQEEGEGDNDGGDGNNSGSDNGGGDGGTVTPQELIYRPEGGAYAQNLAATHTMFNLTLNDRQSFSSGPSNSTAASQDRQFWIRNIGSYTKVGDGSGQLNTEVNAYVLMLGGDIYSAPDAYDGMLKIGIMGGYGNNRSTTDSTLTEYRAHGNVDGYSSGIYGTWYASADQKKGMYVDSWLQYNWFSNNVQGDDVLGEKYRTHGLQGSIEAGYIIPMTDRWYIQPMGQVIWSGVDMDTHQEANGTRVSGNGADFIHSRLGVRTYVDVQSSGDSKKGRFFRPYLELNWLNSNRDYGVSMDDVAISQSGPRNVVEIKAGLEGHITSSLVVNAGISQRSGKSAYSMTSAQLGMSYAF